MLAEDTRLLGQVQKTFYYSRSSQQCEHPGIFVSLLWPQVSWGDMKGPSDVCTVVVLNLGNTNLLLWAEACSAFAPEALSLAVLQTNTYEKTIHKKNSSCLTNKTCRNARDLCPNRQFPWSVVKHRCVSPTVTWYLDMSVCHKSQFLL